MLPAGPGGFSETNYIDHTTERQEGWVEDCHGPESGTVAACATVSGETEAQGVLNHRIWKGQRAGCLLDHLGDQHRHPETLEWELNSTSLKQSQEPSPLS